MTFKRYESRFEAGQLLAEFIEKQDSTLEKLISENPNNFFCFAIPNGGVPIAEGFCSKFNINYDVLIVRKVKIPYNTEAGFGSVTTDGTVLINESLLPHLNLTEKEINRSIEITKNEIKERLSFYGKDIDLEQIYRKNIQKKHIFMIDDGLASGFTMLAAVKMVKKYKPSKIYIAIPTTPLSSVKRVKPGVNDVFSPNVKNVWRFAVADAYLHWYDVPESEVLEILKKSKFYFKK